MPTARPLVRYLSTVGWKDC